MNCKNCDNYARDYGFCRINSNKPRPTGNPKTCPFYERRSNED